MLFLNHFSEIIGKAALHATALARRFVRIDESQEARFRSIITVRAVTATARILSRHEERIVTLLAAELPVDA